ncbi:MAG TPA: KUP/HAK/KT family potassium transporter [Candidatus Methylacidiphilales bacterium]|nr:KUP/HAK/KT family potassium transporter [Candidatus Methylacidiphilales bacterium]
MKSKTSPVSWLAIGSLGVVFGDIGTSPIYTLRQCIQDHPDPSHISGAVSLIVWYLLAIVSLKYVYFLLRLDNHGEGGVFALLALAKLHAPKQKWLFLTLIGGAALLYGDGIITPAISVLSAVEGLAPPTINNVVNPSAWANRWIAALILAALFAVQRFGTDKISKTFAPIMLIWFLAIAGLALPAIFHQPAILYSLNPVAGISFLCTHAGEAMTMLASVTLAITGAEALYADLGHFGRPAISVAWNVIVAPCLILNYLGQGAHALSAPGDVNNLFFSLAPVRFQFLFTLLSITATVIASQALISGAFSLTRQAVNLGYFPRTTVKHTCAEHEGQIYLPGICFLLAIGSIGLVLLFKRSDNLADAYGLAVTGTMVTTTIAYAAISYAQTKRIPWIAGFLLILDLSLFIPNSTKLLTGGYVPVGVGLVVAFILIAWDRTRRAIRRQLAESVMPLEEFAEATKTVHRVRNTGIVLSASPKIAPPSLLHWLKIGQVLHEQVIVLTLVVTSQPRVHEKDRLRVVEHDGNLFGVEADFGFMEEVNVSKLEPALRKIVKAPADRRLYYLLGRESLVLKSKFNLFASAYRYLAGTSRPIAEALNIPPGQVIEIGTTIRI